MDFELEDILLHDEELYDYEVSMYQDKPDLLSDELKHYGVKRRSGRYPWGSGKESYQHSGDFLSRVQELKKQGISESQIAKSMGIGDTDRKGEFHPSTTRLRAQISLAKAERRALDVATAERLRDKEGLGPTEIGRKMGLNESTVRSLLNPKSKENMDKSQETAEFLKGKLKEKNGKFIDVGAGVEKELNISKEKLNQSLEILKMEGYEVWGGRIDQVTNATQKTTVRVLCPPGTKHSEIYNPDNITSLKEYISRDGGQTYEKKFTYPASLDSKRLQIRYADDLDSNGFKGIEKDGVIELRRGVPDLDLGNSNYSQVRIMVDKTHYLKGMAVYSDDMPDGVDVIFNTNKTKDKSMKEVLKEIKKDPDNPFGSAIKDAEQGGQYWYDPKTGQRVSSNTKGAKLGLINKRADEGDWTDWKDKLPSQFLSKQTKQLAKKQLDMTTRDKVDEYNDIMATTNPTVKKRLLDTFANDCDSAAVHLYAAALPRQKYQVILPINSLKDNEVYAPNFNHGEKVALVRYPHGGTFEIPILTVNNKNKLGNQYIGKSSKDAVGINSKIAEQLSGADFDGDTVMIIPTNDKVKIKNRRPLEGLVDFDPKVKYASEKKDDGYYSTVTGKKFKIMANTQVEMGMISNLITDMTIKGATDKELEKAVRHSMVVIDAEKHKLDYRQSYIDNDIATLKTKYQEGGASTLISRSKGQAQVDKRQGSPRVNIKGKEWYDPSKPEGSLVYKTADDLYYPDRYYNKTTHEVTIRTADGKKIYYSMDDAKARNKYEPVEVTDPKTGKVTYTSKDGSITYKTNKRHDITTKMANTDDARTLMSNLKTPMEQLYADYANNMKDLANRARKEAYNTGEIKYNSDAKKAYINEVKSLNDKLAEAEKNAPRERTAQSIANSVVKAKKQANPDMAKDEEKKIRQQALNNARVEVGASRVEIEITPKEWEAIQSGAISPSKLNKILNNTNIDTVRELATPRSKLTLNQSKINRISSMKSLGYTNAEIAKKLGVSTSTVSQYV